MTFFYSSLIFPTTHSRPPHSEDGLVHHFPEKTEIAQEHWPVITSNDYHLPAPCCNSKCPELTEPWVLDPGPQFLLSFSGLLWMIFHSLVFSTLSSRKDLSCGHLYLTWSLPFKTLLREPTQWAHCSQLLIYQSFVSSHHVLSLGLAALHRSHGATCGLMGDTGAESLCWLSITIESAILILWQ